MDATVGALAASLGGEVIGDLDRAIANALALSKAGPDCVTFLADEAKIQEVSDVAAATIIVSRSRQEELTDELREKHTFIVVDDALDGFIEAARQFRSDRPRSAIGISPQAVVSESASLGEGVNIFPGAFLGEDVVIGGFLWTVGIRPSGVQFQTGTDKVLLLFDRSLSSINRVSGQSNSGGATVSTSQTAN